MHCGMLRIRLLKQAEVWKFSVLPRETPESSSSASCPDIGGHGHKNWRLEAPRLALPALISAGSGL